MFKILILGLLVKLTTAFPDQGRWDLTIDQKNSRISIPKSLFKESQIFIQVVCDTHHPDVNITIQWSLTQSICWEDFYRPRDGYYLEELPIAPVNYGVDNRTVSRVLSPLTRAQCSQNGHIILQQNQPILPAPNPNAPPQHPKSTGEQPVFTITADGVYLLTLTVRPDMESTENSFNVSVTIKMRGTYGYLSAVEWPLLPFYACMCAIYVCYGAAWLIICFMQWRDLLRIQFWIGAVVLLGMLEMATFYAEYSSINSTGLSMKGAVLAAEWVSAAKRTLARMLVIIVSLGFGIVKPRLGPMLQRIIALGAVWGVLAALEAWMRVTGGSGSGNSNDILLAAAPLALLDAGLCWWVFASLMHTTRTLRLRRNTVKLALYKHFTNTLIFAALASLVFMLYSIKIHRLADCLKDWKELWIDDAYWHVLFSIVLLVIMILWRPTNNNQRYAFSPLLDNPDDDDDEEDQFVNDAYGVKMRGFSNSGSGSPLIPNSGANGSQASSHNGPMTTSQREEADLRWVEENIPATALPVLDSDEEILNAKFEVSKMQ